MKKVIWGTAKAINAFDIKTNKDYLIRAMGSYTIEEENITNYDEIMLELITYLLPKHILKNNICLSDCANKKSIIMNSMLEEIKIEMEKHNINILDFKIDMILIPDELSKEKNSKIDNLIIDVAFDYKAPKSAMEEGFEASNKIKCTSCGSMIKNNVKFCPECGNKIEK